MCCFDTPCLRDSLIWHGYRSVMQTKPELPDEAREELLRDMLDETFGAARIQYVSVVFAVIVNIEDWLSIDSWLGGGKANDTERREEFGEAFPSFGRCPRLCVWPPNWLRLLLRWSRSAATTLSPR